MGNGNGAASWGVLVLAVLVIALVGAFALLYPTTTSGVLALGSLLTIAGGIGGYYFHTSQQGFLGTQLDAQRRAFVSALNAPVAAATASPTPSATSGNPGGPGLMTPTPTPIPGPSGPVPPGHGVAGG